MFSIFEIALQNANFKIVNVAIICIEMQWQRKKLFLSNRVCVIIKSVYEISASFSNILCFWEFLAMNDIYNVSRITDIIALLNFLVINENISSSINVFVNFASMFTTRFVAFRFIISISIPD